MRLSHNIASLNIYRNQTKAYNSQSIALNNISTGYKVNSAKENPNAIAESERMRMQIRGLQMASRSVQDGMSMLQTTDGALDSVTSTLHRIKQLTVQAGGADSTEERQVIQNEISQMIDAIDQTVDNNEYNGVKLLVDKSITSNDVPSMIYMPSGANVGERVAVPKYNLSTDMLASKTVPANTLKKVSVLDDKGIGDAIETIDSSLDTVDSIRSKYGALENRFESLYQNLNSMSITIEGAESSLRDADIADEMMEYSKDNILVEAGNAMMVQSNNFPREILKVLENVK